VILAEHEWEYIKRNSASDGICGKNKYLFKPKTGQIFVVRNRDAEFQIGPQKIKKAQVGKAKFVWERDKNLSFKEKAKMMKKMFEAE